MLTVYIWFWPTLHMCTAREKHYELEHHTLNANIPNALCTECEARDMHMCTAREIPRE
jgi:hypothetical protein